MSSHAQSKNRGSAARELLRSDKTRTTYTISLGLSVPKEESEANWARQLINKRHDYPIPIRSTRDFESETPKEAWISLSLLARFVSMNGRAHDGARLQGNQNQETEGEIYLNTLESRVDPARSLFLSPSPPLLSLCFL